MLKSNVEYQGQGHDATCSWKGLDLIKIAREYDVSPLTNDKVIIEIQNWKW